MTLYEEWQDLLTHQTEDSFDDFWEKYAGAEQELYKVLLEQDEKAFEGKFADLAKKYEIEPVFMMAFLDGITESLNSPLETENINEDSDISLSVDYEKLYFNMHKANAPHLFQISAWENKLTADKMSEIEKEYKKSKTYIKEQTPKRNDPCPCGSGKKYKKCCGKG
ncbi:MAG: SEC-C domain-containing protein [Clostridiales bacterium]|nr:SEC-C domain-containing protein [Clostridiales bacterium]